MSSQGYQLAIGGNFKFVKGWLQWAIKPPNPDNKKLPGDNGLPYGGSWLWAAKNIHSATGWLYWDSLTAGTVGKDVPIEWLPSDQSTTLGVGVWNEGGTVKTEYGVKYPWKVAAWTADDESYWAPIKATWEARIPTVWSNIFDIKRDQCPSTDPQCCRYHTQFTASFNAVDTWSKGTIVMGANREYVRSTVTCWCMGDSRANLPAHEFGHLIGNPDEYPKGSTLDTTISDGPAPGICPDSIMGVNLSTVKARHFRSIMMQLSMMVDTAGNQKYGFTYQAVTAQPC
jgi:hypothetical protein